MSILQLLSILRARAAVIGVILAVTTFSALCISLLLPKQYATSAAIVVDVKSLDPVAGTVLPGMLQPGYMSTQLDIINSTRVAGRVIKMLDLTQDPKLQQQWKDETGGKGEFDEWLAKRLLAKLDARPSRDSNVIQIAFTSDDPKFAAAVANAFAQAFIDIDLELKIEPARRYVAWFEEQGKQARQKLEQAQKALSAYQQETGAIADERFDAEKTRIYDMTHQLSYLQAEVNDLASKKVSNAANTPDAMSNVAVGQLKSEIARREATLQLNSGNLGANHPQILREKAQLASLRSQLNLEIGQVSASFQNSYKVAKDRERLLLDSLGAQKAHVLDMTKQRDQFSVLTRDVDAAQKEYDTITQRLSQMRLESRSSQTNVSILNAAPLPMSAAKPKVLLNTLAGALAGLVLGFGVALLMEISDRRVRSPMDLALAVDVPVLATIASARRIASKSSRFQRRLPYTASAT